MTNAFLLAKTTSQTQNQYLVLLHCFVPLPGSFRCFPHHMEIHMAMGILDCDHTMGCGFDSNRCLYGRDILRSHYPKRPTASTQIPSPTSYRCRAVEKSAPAKHILSGNFSSCHCHHQDPGSSDDLILCVHVWLGHWIECYHRLLPAFNLSLWFRIFRYVEPIFSPCFNHSCHTVSFKTTGQVR